MEKNNKLIAEFMGAATRPKHAYEFLRYDSDWDWLMPVVEKIQSLGYEVQIRNTDCIIFQLLDTLKYKPIVDISSGNAKDSTYDAVVEFIKYQNN